MQIWRLSLKLNVALFLSTDLTNLVMVPRYIVHQPTDTVKTRLYTSAFYFLLCSTWLIMLSWVELKSCVELRSRGGRAGCSGWLVTPSTMVQVVQLTCILLVASFLLIWLKNFSALNPKRALTVTQTNSIGNIRTEANGYIDVTIAFKSQQAQGKVHSLL